MDNLLADLRYGLRVLRRTPIFVVVTIGTLALGIGLCPADRLRQSQQPAALPRDEPTR
jgi:hypothetical protein